MNDPAYNTSYSFDNRAACPPGYNASNAESIMCLDPFDTQCEVLTFPTQICFDSEQHVCIDIQLIFIGIFLSNIAQIIFETSFTLSIEMTVKPT